MSGWSDFASFAKTALTTAQKKIDNVLDIRESGGDPSKIPTEENVNPTATGSVGLQQLQEDFFSAFGLQSSSSTSSPPPITDVDASSESNLNETATAKPWLALGSAWLGGTPESSSSKKSSKSSWTKWLGAVPPADDEENEGNSSTTTVLPAAEKFSFSDSSDICKERSDSEPEPISKESTCNSLKLNDSDDGWCTENLLVPREDPAISGDLLITPGDGDTAGFTLPSGAHLTLVDDDECIENFGEYETVLKREELSSHRVSSWVLPFLEVETDNLSGSQSSLANTNLSNNDVTPKASQTNFFFESDSEKSLCTLVDHNQNSSVDMSSSSKSQDTVVDDGKDPCPTPQIRNLEREKDDEYYFRQAADCVEGILMKISTELEDDEYDRQSSQNSPPSDHTTDEEMANVHSLAESFVQLDPQTSSPNFCQQKSETSSIVKGSGYSSPLEDMETNASSDIEIISTPNGDNGSECSSSRSGVARIVGHSSKTKHRRVNSDQNITAIQNVNLHKKMSFDGSGSESDKKLQYLSEIVDARERKLVEISKENAQLADENEQLRRELQDVHSRISSTMNVEMFQKDHSERMASLERKLDSTTKEKDNLKRKCENLEKEICTKVSAQQFQQMLQDKDQQIQELMQEGEKLSRNELKHNNVVKKLREKDKENEKTIESQRTKLLEMDNLKRKLRSKEEQELKYDEIVTDLKTTVEKQEKVFEKLKSEYEDARDKCSSYKLALENCAKEIAELRKEIAMKDAEIERFLTNAEESKENELHEKLFKATKEFQEERQKMLKEKESAKLFADQTQDEFNRREFSLRWETNQLQQKLQEAEARNQELSESIATATKPLLRQIDSLQISFQSQQNNWERLEKSLYERLAEAERKSLTAQEREQAASSALSDLRIKFVQIENQISNVNKEKQKLESTVSLALRDSQTAAASQAKCAEELENEKSLQTAMVEELQKEKDLISTQFEYEKTHLVRSFDLKIEELEAKLSEKEFVINSLKNQLIEEQKIQTTSNESKSRPISPGPPLIANYRNRSISPSSASAMMADEVNEDLWSHELSAGGFSSFLERLRSKLQQREGEMMVLKEELKHIQNSRDSVALSLIALSNEKHDLETQLQDSATLREQYHVLDANYQALLQMYGEKVEENEELKMDLDDVKSLYKQQLEDLLKNSN